MWSAVIGLRELVGWWQTGQTVRVAATLARRVWSRSGLRRRCSWLRWQLVQRVPDVGRRQSEQSFRITEPSELQGRGRLLQLRESTPGDCSSVETCLRVGVAFDEVDGPIEFV